MLQTSVVEFQRRLQSRSGLGHFLTQAFGFRRQCLVAVLAVAAVVTNSSAVQGQPSRLHVGDLREDYVRVLQLAGVIQASPILIRPIAREVLRLRGVDSVSHPWASRYQLRTASESGRVEIGFFDPEFRALWNSAFARGQNDGVAWQGRGVTMLGTAGAYARYGPMELTLRPSIVYTQNREFEIAEGGSTPYANAWHRSIDLPQRFGSDPYTTFDLGQSAIRVDWFGASLGVSNESMWWGPGVRNAIIMSNNAPGFPHAFVGTSRPLNVGIGWVEAHWIWGRLSESKYFDSVDSNDTRFITGIVADFEPKLLPGLYLGGSRVFQNYIPSSGLPLGEYLLVFKGVMKVDQVTPDHPHGNDPHDQKLSLFARWLFPKSGFETYVEWAREDHSWDLRDFLLEPGHSEAYTLGFQKVYTMSGGNRYARLQGELTHLEADKSILVRPTGTYYVHSAVRQGYTHRGQVIGAGIGPGSNSQFLRGDLFSEWGSVGLHATRVVHDNDAYYRFVGDARNFGQHHVEVTVGASARLFLGRWVLSGGTAYSKQLNRYFILRNDPANLNAQVSMRWEIPRIPTIRDRSAKSDR